MTATLNQPGVDDFFAKDIPEPFQILGLRLLPLSIGRYRRMARHGIGFVSEVTELADGKDLLLGVLICSMTCRAWDELAVSGRLPQIIASWMRQINAAPPWYMRHTFISASFIGARWRKNHSFDLLGKVRLFQTYVEAAQVVPKFLRKNNDGGMSSDHWS